MDRSDFRQTEKRNDTGKEESAKGTQEGFLSRSINSFSNRSVPYLCSKNWLQRIDKTLLTR